MKNYDMFYGNVFFIQDKMEEARDGLKYQREILLDQRRELEQKIDTILNEKAIRIAELEKQISDLADQNDALKSELKIKAAEVTSLKLTHPQCSCRSDFEVLINTIIPASNTANHMVTEKATVAEKQIQNPVITLPSIPKSDAKSIPQSQLSLSKLNQHQSTSANMKQRYSLPYSEDSRSWTECVDKKTLKVIKIELPLRELNTRDESFKILALLNKYNISQAFFAKTRLNMRNVDFERLIESPVSWTSMSEQDQKQYTRIHAWTSSKSSEWEELKQSFDRYRAHKAEIDMQYRLTKKLKR
jgi:hypothetical protein